MMRGRSAGSILTARTRRSSCGSTLSRGTTATPIPAATSACTVGSSSVRNTTWWRSGWGSCDSGRRTPGGASDNRSQGVGPPLRGARQPVGRADCSLPRGARTGLRRASPSRALTGARNGSRTPRRARPPRPTGRAPLDPLTRRARAGGPGARPAVLARSVAGGGPRRWGRCRPDYLAARCGRAQVGTAAGKDSTHVLAAAEHDRTCLGGPHDARSGRALDNPRAHDTLERGNLLGDGRLHTESARRRSGTSPPIGGPPSSATRWRTSSRCHERSRSPIIMVKYSRLT